MRYDSSAKGLVCISESWLDTSIKDYVLVRKQNLYADDTVVLVSHKDKNMVESTLTTELL